MKVPSLLPMLLVLVAASVARAADSAEDWAAWGRQRAEVLEREGLFDEALEEWTNVSQILPRDVSALSRAATLAVDIPVLKGKDLVEGTPNFKIAELFVQSGISRGGQGDAGLAYAIGRLRFAEGRAGVAWKMFGDAKDWGFDPVRARYWLYRASVNRASDLIDVARHEEAAASLEALLKEQPGHPDERYLKYTLAAAHHGMQEPEVARKMIQETMEKEPESAEPHFLLGLIYTEEGRLDEAEAEFRATMTRASKTYADQTFRNALLRLCDLQLKRGQIREAEISAERLMEIAKDEPECLYRLGRVRQAQERLDEAVPLFRRAARLMPNSLQTLINLQQTLFLIHEEAEAEAIGKRIESIRRRRSGDADGKEPAPSGPRGPDEKPDEKSGK